jgi:hypothetical protein
MKALICAVMAMIVALSLAGPASAAQPSQVPPSGQYHPTLAQVKAGEQGRVLGPNAYTQYGRATIAGWSVSGKYTRVSLKTAYVSPLGVRLNPGSGLATPNSWYNPGSWDWGHILGSTWNGIWNNCAKGSLTGVVGTASGTLIVNLLVRGGAVFVGPEGYAAIAIGGCVVNLVFG